MTKPSTKRIALALSLVAAGLWAPVPLDVRSLLFLTLGAAFVWRAFLPGVLVLVGSSFVWGGSGPFGIPALGYLLVFLLVSRILRGGVSRSTQVPTHPYLVVRRSDAVLSILIGLVGAMWLIRGAESGDERFLYLEVVFILLAGLVLRPRTQDPGELWAAAQWIGVGMLGTVAYIYPKLLTEIFGSPIGELDRRVGLDVGVSNYLVIQVVFAGLLWTALALRRVAPYWLALLALLPGVHLLLLVGTRSGAVALVVFCAIETWAALVAALRTGKGGQVMRVAVLSVTVISIYLLFPSLLAERIAGGTGDNGRFDLYRESLRQATDHPLFGVGVSGLIEAFEEIGQQSNYSHNFVMDAVARFGILIGILISVVFVPRLRSRSGINLLSVMSALIAISLLEPAISTLRIGSVVLVLLLIDDALSKGSSHHSSDVVQTERDSSEAPTPI